jgi:ribosomal-protein-alanine N-acetyltransferase
MLGIAGTQALAITTGDVVSGFILKRSIAGEAEILTLCTNPAMRRHGHARRLLREAIARLRHDGVQALFLDVAADNDAALSLYKAEGFSQTGRRKNYYNRRSGHCDALLLRLQLS